MPITSPSVFIYDIRCNSLVILLHQLLAKNARFKQIWKSRKENGTHASDDALRDMYHFYDVERVDAGETSGVQEQE